jgi:hypothetical protein
MKVTASQVTKTFRSGRNSVCTMLWSEIVACFLANLSSPSKTIQHWASGLFIEVTLQENQTRGVGQEHVWWILSPLRKTTTRVRNHGKNYSTGSTSTAVNSINTFVRFMMLLWQSFIFSERCFPPPDTPLTHQPTTAHDWCAIIYRGPDAMIHRNKLLLTLILHNYCKLDVKHSSYSRHITDPHNKARINN